MEIEIAATERKVDEPVVAVQTDTTFREIVLWPSSQPLRFLFLAEWRDVAGRNYYPIVHVQFRAWSDDSTRAWQYLSIDEFVVRRDTIVVKIEELQTIDYQMQGVNFSFRARLSSGGVHTDWVRLRESIRFYSREREGIPRQPRGLKLIR